MLPVAETPIVSPPLLQLRAIEKSFAGTRALHPLALAIAPGESIGLVGENGAGKSTLIKILSGLHSPDAGSIEWNGTPLRLTSPHDAMAAGIATIHQELACCGHLTVAENLLLGETWPRHRWGGVDWNQLHARAAAQLARCEINLPTHRAFHQLSAAQKQEVAIARALSRNAKLLILDEPTASLSEREVERLFAQLQQLRAAGVAMLYVSHRLEEILKLTDRIAVLRDGELVATYPTGEATVQRMVKDMVGRPLDQIYPHTRKSAANGEPVLELQNISRQGMFEDISLTVRAGEIVGLAGLVGAGRSELARAIYGLYPCDSGRMNLHGRPWTPRGAQDSLAARVVYLPEERKRQSLVLEHSVHATISLGFSDLIARGGTIRRHEEQSRVTHAMRSHDVRAASPTQPIGTLSGGNQQKAILARWLERQPDLLLLDEPTRGIDVGAKAEIHQVIDRLAASGRAVLLISSDLPEILGMSDRVVVLHQGRLVAELSGPAMTQENVMLAASGLHPAHP